MSPTAKEDCPVPPLVAGKVPVTPVLKGRPVAFVSVTDVGVPKTGVTSVGLVERTLLPEPVEVVTPVPPLATGSVPVTPVVKGKPVAFVRTPEAGVPSAGVTNVGLVSVGLVDSTTLPVPVDVDTPVPPEATGKADNNVSEDRYVIWSPTSVPLLYTTVRLPVGTATPVWPETFTVTA